MTKNSYSPSEEDMFLFVVETILNQLVLTSDFTQNFRPARLMDNSNGTMPHPLATTDYRWEV